MKRRLIADNQVLNYVPIKIPENLKNYAQELRLLKGVPISYLLSQVPEISEESIRFFILDINWTDALLDGAFSIGRVCGKDCLSDACVLNAAKESVSYFDTPRLKRMHPNHKKTLEQSRANYADEDYQLVSGFIMRSQLVHKMPGLLLYGYDKDGAPKENLDNGTPLNILRIDPIAEDILLCLFHGELSEILIAEPKTGLRFGVSTVEKSGEKISRSIDLRSALDSPELGDRIGSFCIDKFTGPNGRLRANELAKAIEAQLKEHKKLGVENITPSRFAFEMIAVAHRAKFIDSGKEKKNGR